MDTGSYPFKYSRIIIWYLYAMNNKVQIKIENTFVSNEKSNEDLGITSYSRAFRKLTHENKGIGKILPINIKIDDEYFLFGVFAFVRSGLTSFFPELPEGTFFDHFTFGKSIASLNAHLTEIIDDKNEKIIPLSPEHLTNGTYHVATFIFQDLELLKITPRIIKYPAIDIKQSELLEDALFTRGDYNGSGNFELIGDKGPVFIQMFLIPKGEDFSNLQFCKSVIIEKISDNFKDDILASTKKLIFFVKHEFQDDYQIGIVAFRYPEDIKTPAYFGFSMDPSMSYIQSSDEEFNKLIREQMKKALQRRRNQQNK